MSQEKYFRQRYLNREDYLKLPTEQRLIKLNKPEDERAKELLDKLIMIDVHGHSTIHYPYTLLPHLPLSPPSPDLPVFLDGRIERPLRKELGEFFLALRRYTLETYWRNCTINWIGLKESGITAVLQPVFSGGEQYDACITSLGFNFADVEKNALGKRAYYAEDIRTAKREGKIAFMAASEANVFGYVLDRVTILYGLGLRASGLTYEQGNYCGSGGSDPRNTGLSPFGAQVVDRMNKLGMIIDLSHAGRKTSMDVIERSRDPVMFSHNGAAHVYPKGGRCLADDQLKALTERHGIIGISAVPNALSNSRRQGLKDWFDHFNYCVDLIGIDHVAIGTDINWQDHVALHRLTERDRERMLGGSLSAEYMEGIENPTEAYPNIVRCLVAEGYSDSEIDKVVGSNALRFVEEVVG